jgi:hypothetical protein
MKKRTTYLASIAALALGMIAASSAQARFTMMFRQDGSDVVVNGRGTIDLTELTFSPTGPNYVPQLNPSAGILASGPLSETPEDLYVSATISRTGFGPGPGGTPNASSGDAVGIDTTSTTIIVPQDYISGSFLADTSTYTDTTFAELGLTPGTYRYGWGSGDHLDTFTIVIPGGVGLPVPEPSTWAMMLIGFAGLGYAAVGRKGAIHASSA